MINVNAAALPVGVYAGQITFSAGSTSMAVPVTLSVDGSSVPFFGGVAGELSFISGNSFTAIPQVIQLLNVGTGALNWSAAVSTAAGGNWLNVSAPSGTAPSTVTVSVSTQGLAAGTYSGQVLFQAPSGNMTVPVTLVVADSNTNAFEQLPGPSFTMAAGGSNPLSQTLTVASTGSGFYVNSPTVQTASGGNWLQITGCANGFNTPEVCTININATTLPAGVYAGQVIFSNGSTSMTVPVTLSVQGDGVPFFGGDIGELSFVGGNGFTSTPQSIQISNAGAGQLNWTATTSIFRTGTVGSVNWLTVSPGSGAAPSTVTVSVSTQGLAAGTYGGEVLFQAPSGSMTVPVTLVVDDSSTNTFEQLPGASFTMAAGGSNPLSQTLTVTSTGSGFYVNSPTVQTASGGNWLQITGCANGFNTPAVCSINITATTLPAGVYAGQVIFNSGSTSMTVPMTLSVQGAGDPFLGGDTGELSFVGGNGFTPAPQSVQILNAGTGQLNWTATTSIFRTGTVGSVNWLTVSPGSGTAPSTVTVSVSTQGLAAGTYGGEVLFQAPSGNMTVPVTLVVDDSSTNTFEQLPGVSFTMAAGGSNPLSQTLTVTSTGSGFYVNSPTVQTASGGTWLQVTGCANGFNTPAVCSINIAAATLPAGVYTGQVIFSTGSASMTVPVTLSVQSAGVPFFGGITGGLNFVGGSGISTTAPQTIQLTNAGTGTLNWTAATSTFETSTVGALNWLTVSAASGAAPSSVTVSVSTQGLAPGIYLGQILFTAQSGSVTIPVSLVITSSNGSTFQQLTALNFTAPVGGPNPLAQSLTLNSTGSNFYFSSPTVQTASGGNWLQLTGCANGDNTPAACSIGVSVATLPSGIYAGQVVFSNGSTAMTVPVTLTVGNPNTTTPSTPAISSGGIVSASAFGGFTAVAPGSWIEIYGTGLAADSRSWTGADFTGNTAPTSLDGTSVTIGGQNAFIDYISPGQVNAQVPSNAGTGAQPVIVKTAAGASAALTLTVNPEEPGLLAPASFKVGGTQYVAALFSDGATFVLPAGAISGVTSRPAKPGDVITLYGVGFGSVTPNIPAGQIVQQSNTLVAPLHVLFGSAEATVEYDGLAPSAVGLYQFNVVVPNVTASNAVPLTFTLAGVAGTQTLYIAVQN